MSGASLFRCADCDSVEVRSPGLPECACELCGARSWRRVLFHYSDPRARAAAGFPPAEPEMTVSDVADCVEMIAGELGDAVRRLRALSESGPASYLVWSHEHSAWWRPARAGYTTFLEAAGRYTREEALVICRTARGGWRPGQPPPEIPVRLEDALAVEAGDAVR